MTPIESPPLIDQVEFVISWAQREARRTGKRYRVRGARGSDGNWYYEARDTAAWSRALVLDVGTGRWPG